MNTELITQSYQKASANKSEFADFFFTKLFQNFREANPLFTNADIEKLKIEFIRSLDFAVDHIHEPEILNIYLSQMGKRLERAGVLGYHYAFFGKTLIDTLSHFLPQSWSNELMREWVMIYESLVDAMNSSWDQN